MHNPKKNEALRWGEGREMNALETLMWRIEADPRLRSTICAIEVLDRVPDWQRFLAACDWGTRMVPRFRQKVAEPALGVGNPCWINDPDFDLRYHVRRCALPEGGGWPELLAIAEQVAMTPFDRARSPWEVVLFEGLPDGRAAYLLKIHHATTDGLGGIQLVSQLHSRTREANPDKPQPPPPPPERATPFGLLREQLGRDARAVPQLVRKTLRHANALRDPVTSARQTRTFASSLRRVLAEADAAGSPLLRRRSLSWRFLAFEVAFQDLRAAAKAANASVNDAFVSALLGAYRIYHEELGSPIDRIPIAIPISIRSHSDGQGGNRFVGARFAAPAGVVGPRERTQAVSAIVREIRNEPAVDALSTLAPVLARLPGSLLNALAGSLTRSNDLQASSVPGIREDVYVAGAKVERSYPFGPLPGCAAMVAMVTHGSTCCIGVNLDAAAVTDVPLFGDCIVRGLKEVLSLHPDARDPVALIGRPAAPAV